MWRFYTEIYPCTKKINTNFTEKIIYAKGIVKMSCVMKTADF